MYLYLNTVLTKVFAIVFVFGKFIVFVFVFKYYAMYLDPSLVYTYAFDGHVCVCTYVCVNQAHHTKLLELCAVDILYQILSTFINFFFYVHVATTPMVSIAL